MAVRFVLEGSGGGSEAVVARASYDEAGTVASRMRHVASGRWIPVAIGSYASLANGDIVMCRDGEYGSGFGKVECTTKTFQVRYVSQTLPTFFEPALPFVFHKAGVDTYELYKAQCAVCDHLVTVADHVDRCSRTRDSKVDAVKRAAWEGEALVELAVRRFLLNAKVDSSRLQVELSKFKSVPCQAAAYNKLVEAGSALVVAHTPDNSSAAIAFRANVKRRPVPVIKVFLESVVKPEIGATVGVSAALVMKLLSP